MSSKRSNHENQPSKDDMLASEYNEFDDLKNIKSQLDHSLELSEIHVSEELLQRTLEAIKKAQEDPTSVEIPLDSTIKKRNLWMKYIRNAAAVAAAFIIFVGGFSILNANTGLLDGVNFSAMNKADSKSAPGKAACDTAQRENGVTQDDMKYGESESMDKGGLPESVAGGENAIDRVTKAPEFVDDGEKEGSITELTSNQEKKFGSIFLSSPSQTSYIKITKTNSDAQLILKNPKDMKKLYLLLEGYTFRITETDPSTSDHMFIIQATSLDVVKERYTMRIGDSITITKEVGSDDKKKTLVYTTQDVKSLIIKLSDFYKKYKK